MRVAASMLTLIAVALAGTSIAQAQSADKPAQTSTQKAQKTPRVAATPERGTASPVRAAPQSTGSKVEGGSTMRSMPVDTKKGGSCHSMADDA